METLVTLFLATLLVTTLLALSRRALQDGSALRGASEGAALSASLMSRILSGEEKEHSGKLRQGTREFRWSVKFVDFPEGRLRGVDLLVEWEELGKPRTFTLSTLQVTPGPDSKTPSPGAESGGTETGTKGAGSRAWVSSHIPL